MIIVAGGEGTFTQEDSKQATGWGEGSLENAWQK